ncbi:hypothetical protein QOS_0016, partial [Clostridioides difficile Y184]
RRGKKIKSGDIVEIEGTKIKVLSKKLWKEEVKENLTLML